MSRLAIAPVTIAVLAAAITTADARERRGPLANFAAMDVDGSGGVTLEELKSFRGERFSHSDLDGDGEVTRAELVESLKADIQARIQRMAERRADKILSRADRDGSGTLTPDERGLGSRIGRWFDKLDSNGDGEISTAEADVARQRWEERRARRGE